MDRSRLRWREDIREQVQLAPIVSRAECEEDGASRDTKLNSFQLNFKKKVVKNIKLKL